MNEIDNTNENKYYKVGIYLRLSNEDKDKNDNSESIKNQRNMLIDYINKHPEFVFVQEYCDEDLSGAGTFRPEFERLIKDCEDKKLDIVLCKSQSRFSRDMEIVERYINNKFKEWNVRFIGLADSADTQNSGNKKSRQINGLVNEWYLEDVSNNIRSAFNSKMKQGEFISPFAAFGYDISNEDNNKLVIDPIASEVVKNIFNLYLKGYGFTAIAKNLNNNNIPSPSLYKYKRGIKLNVVSKRPREDIKWTANAIKTILTNQLYIGHLIQGKRTTVSYKNHKTVKKDKSQWIKKENTHEAIISQDIFNKVQIAIKKRTKPIKSTGIVHNFSGKVFCLNCNHYMRKKNSIKHEYLVCSNNRDGYNDCPNKSSIRYDVLEDIVLKHINNLIKKYYDIIIIEGLFIKNNINKFSNKISSLEKQKLDMENNISKTKYYLKSLYEDKVNKIITNEIFLDLINNYNMEKKKLISQIKYIDNEITFYKAKEKSLVNYQKLINDYQHIKKLNKIIIDEFIDKIFIGELINNTRAIKIKWNY